MSLYDFSSLYAAYGSDEESLCRAIEDLAQEYGGKIFQQLFSYLFNKEFTKETATWLWNEAMHHRAAGKKVSSHRAVLLDYLHTTVGQLENPRVIESGVLESLQRSTITDGLTCLYNQSHFKRKLERLVSDFEFCQEQKFALAFLDLDHFKQYNDRCGHLLGDQILCQIGQLLHSALPQGALAARYGGEVFAVLLPGFELPQTVLFAENIRARIEQTHFEGEDRLDSGCLTVSIGVACCPASGRSAGALLAHADNKLSEAKRERNQVAPRPADSRAVLRHELRNLIEIYDPSDNCYRASLCADISSAGLLLKSALAAEVGSEIELRFPLPFWPNQHAASARVRHIRSSGSTGARLIGIEFDQPQVDFMAQVLPAEILSLSS